MEGGEREIEGGERERWTKKWWSSRGRLSGGMKLTWTTNSMRPSSTISLGRNPIGRPRSFPRKIVELAKRESSGTVKTSAKSKDVEVTRCGNLKNCIEVEVSVSVDDNDKEFSNHMAQDTPKTKLKSLGKSPHPSRSSTLMKPTASQLAKQNPHREVHSNRLLRRVAKKLGKLDEKSHRILRHLRKGRSWRLAMYARPHASLS